MYESSPTHTIPHNSQLLGSTRIFYISRSAILITLLTMYNSHSLSLPLLINCVIGETLCGSTSGQNQDTVDMQDVVYSSLSNEKDNSTFAQH